MISNFDGNGQPQDPEPDREAPTARPRHPAWSQAWIDRQRREFRAASARSRPWPPPIPVARKRGRRVAFHDAEPVYGLRIVDHRPQGAAEAQGRLHEANRRLLAHLASLGRYTAAHLLSERELACPRNAEGSFLKPDHDPSEIGMRKRSPWKQATIVLVGTTARLQAQRQALAPTLPRCVGCFNLACGPDRPVVPGASPQPWRNGHQRAPVRSTPRRKGESVTSSVGESARRSRKEK